MEVLICPQPHPTHSACQLKTWPSVMLDQSRLCEDGYISSHVRLVLVYQTLLYNWRNFLLLFKAYQCLLTDHPSDNSLLLWWSDGNGSWKPHHLTVHWQNKRNKKTQVRKHLKMLETYNKETCMKQARKIQSFGSYYRPALLPKRVTYNDQSAARLDVLCSLLLLEEWMMLVRCVMSEGTGS